jgi:hypothetical protein
MDTTMTRNKGKEKGKADGKILSRSNAVSAPVVTCMSEYRRGLDW